MKKPKLSVETGQVQAALFDGFLLRIIKSKEFLQHNPEMYALHACAAIVTVCATVVAFVLPVTLPPLVFSIVPVAVSVFASRALANFHRGPVRDSAPRLLAYGHLQRSKVTTVFRFNDLAREFSDTTAKGVDVGSRTGSRYGPRCAWLGVCLFSSNMK